MPFSFIAPIFVQAYLTLQSFDFERTLWRSFQKHVVCTKLYIYIFVKRNERVVTSDKEWACCYFRQGMSVLLLQTRNERVVSSDKEWGFCYFRQGMSALLLQRPLNVTTTDNSRARTFYPFCVLFWGILSFCHFIVFSSNYGFWFSQWYLQTLQL